MLSYPQHATDNLGFPLNPACCADCLARSKAMNAEYLNRVLAWDMTPDDFTMEEDWSKR